MDISMYIKRIEAVDSCEGPYPSGIMPECMRFIGREHQL